MASLRPALPKKIVTKDRLASIIWERKEKGKKRDGEGFTYAKRKKGHDVDQCKDGLN